MKIEQGPGRTGVLFRIRHRLCAPDIAAMLCPKQNKMAAEMRSIGKNRIDAGGAMPFESRTRIGSNTSRPGSARPTAILADHKRQWPGQARPLFNKSRVARFALRGGAVALSQALQ
jgi:hypothetical protein